MACLSSRYSALSDSIIQSFILFKYKVKSLNTTITLIKLSYPVLQDCRVRIQWFKFAMNFTVKHRCNWNYSLRSKRFRGVWEQRKSEERDFGCFACAKNGSQKTKEGVLLLAPFFARAKRPKIPFLWISLLPNPTETFVTQATETTFQIFSTLPGQCRFTERITQIILGLLHLNTKWITYQQYVLLYH